MFVLPKGHDFVAQSRTLDICHPRLRSFWSLFRGLDLFPNVLPSTRRQILGQRVKALVEEQKIDFAGDFEKSLN